jgi:hypothetical protein
MTELIELLGGFGETICEVSVGGRKDSMNLRRVGNG